MQTPALQQDSQAFYFQRWRLFTTVESADLKARAVWGVEVGDITWGAGGGASGDEYGTGTNSRVGPGQGGGLGADGVNVETKNLYLQFELPWVPGLSLLLGAHNIQILDSPVGAFLDDDAFGIQLAWRQEPVAVQLWTAKADENARESADDNTFYAARLWVDVTKDLTVSLEGLIVDAQCFGRREPVAPATTGTCFSAGFGDNLWVGSTVRATLGPVRLDGSVVYGQRLQLCPACDDGTARARGWGVQASARAPVGPVSLWGQAWYTTGDDQQVTGGPSAFSVIPLAGDSDKLPLPIHQASWLTGPLVAEWLFGNPTLGSPFTDNANYSRCHGHVRGRRLGDRDDHPGPLGGRRPRVRGRHRCAGNLRELPRGGGRRGLLPVQPEPPLHAAGRVPGPGRRGPRLGHRLPHPVPLLREHPDSGPSGRVCRRRPASPGGSRNPREVRFVAPCTGAVLSFDTLSSWGGLPVRRLALTLLGSFEARLGVGRS